MVGFLQAMATRPGISADDVVLAGTALSFDPSVLELFLPLIHGAQIVIADRYTMIDPKALAALLHRSGVTIMQATPTTWQMLVNDAWEGDPHLTALCGGEPMSMDLLDAMIVRCRSLWNLYGPTEATVWATVHEVDGPADRARRSVPVGRPIDNVRCYVLDQRGGPVPKGVPGELFIGGPGVARGYANRSDLTAELFVRDPFVDVAGARMYRTGDLARLLSDGTLDCWGGPTTKSRSAVTGSSCPRSSTDWPPIQPSNPRSSPGGRPGRRTCGSPRTTSPAGRSPSTATSCVPTCAPPSPRT